MNQRKEEFIKNIDGKGVLESAWLRFCVSICVSVFLSSVQIIGNSD